MKMSGGAVNLRGDKKEFLEDSTTNSEPFHIDFVSLDIEGGEVSLLACWPWKKMSPLVWSIEVNKVNHEKLIDEIMLRNGYLKYDNLDGSAWQVRDAWDRLDSVYVRRDYLGLTNPPIFPFLRDVEYYHKNKKSMEYKWEMWTIFTQCDMSRRIVHGGHRLMAMEKEEIDLLPF